jgi:hypothetical protein
MPKKSKEEPMWEGEEVPSVAAPEKTEEREEGQKGEK